ncbi:class II aldolase/adducin family protein [Actinomadura sp. LOL_016]|uniref:class II aldolase/adducin family protein n=1 Tax=unclassified Actinomadura TaxID=2626254 RepID=UPI003A7FFF67
MSASLENNVDVLDGEAREMAEWQVRCDLAAAYQLIDLYGMSDLVGTHISARVPGPEDHFLLNPMGTTFDQITASSLIKVDVDGNVVSGASKHLNFAGFVIHSSIHMSSPHLTCALHTHTAANNAVAAMAEGLLPLTQKALFTLAFLRYHDFEGAAEELSERERIVRDLGDGRVILLRNHGALTVGESISEAWVRMYQLEQACRFQVAAMSCAAGGMTPIQLSEQTIEHVQRQARQIWAKDGRYPIGPTEWPSLLRKLERERGTSYKD